MFGVPSPPPLYFPTVSCATSNTVLGVHFVIELSMPRTMSAAEYQELGKRYYKQKEYQKAVDAFTEAIESMTIPTTGMLNNRAASYEKLENYNAACKDGRHMIKLDKSDAKVGLRPHCVGRTR